MKRDCFGYGRLLSDAKNLADHDAMGGIFQYPLSIDLQYFRDFSSSADHVRKSNKSVNLVWNRNIA